ncbi:unnamed protein product [Trichobilharzia szidati]|nr:unnamed protein product [Trichobilharzia szidati]
MFRYMVLTYVIFSDVNFLSTVRCKVCIKNSSFRVLRCSIGSAILSQVPLSRCLSNKTDPEFGITNIQDDNDFQKRVLENPAPVLVDFHAKWCGPCKILGPRLENVMKSYMKSVLLAKVDVDQLDTIAEKYK